MATAFAAAPILTGVLVASTAVTVGVGIFTGIRQAQAAEAAAEQEELQQTQLGIQAQQRQNEILEEEIDTLAALNVGAAASGIDPFTGSPQRTAERIQERADRQLRTARLEGAFGISASQSRQRQLRLQGQASLIGGFGEAVGAVGSGAVTARGIA